MGSVPSVPNIETPQSVAPSQSIDNLLTGVVRAAQAPLPPQYSSGTTIAEPRMPVQPQFTPANTNNQPMTNQATSIKEARRKNTFASIGNLIGQAGQNIQNKKNIELKEDLTTVMQAKTNVANAKAVLAQDPNNAMAKKVLTANMQSLNAILSDPKKQKRLAKALDISFTDPEKNKTPEIQAYKSAMEEHKGNGAFNSSNPDEHAVAQMAQKNELGATLNPVNNQPPQQEQQSATPYADKAIAKDLPSIQQNSAYSTALKEREAAQKALYTQVLPKVIEAESRAQVQAVKDGNAAAREQYKAVTDAQAAQNKLIGSFKLQDQKAKDALTLQSRKDAAAMARVVTDVSARLKIADDKRLDPTAKSKLQTDALAKIDQSVTALTAQRASLTTQLANAKGNEDEEQILNAAIALNTAALEGTNKYRLETSEKIYGKLAQERNGGSESNSNSTGVSKSNIPVAGDGLSDEDDTDDDSDDY